MSNTITRRAALTDTAAGAAAIVAGTGPANALDHDRAEWLALWQALLDQNPRDTAAINAAENAEFAARDEHPKQRIRTWELSYGIRKGEKSWGWGWWPSSSLTSLYIRHRLLHRDTIEEHYQEHIQRLKQDEPQSIDKIAEGEDYRAQSLAEYDAWAAECRAIDERFNLSALQDEQAREHERLQVIIGEIAQRPAQSVVGVAVKLAMARYYSSLNCDELESACDDALQLAGLPADMGEVRS